MDDQSQASSKSRQAELHSVLKWNAQKRNGWLEDRGEKNIQISKKNKKLKAAAEGKERCHWSSVDRFALQVGVDSVGNREKQRDRGHAKKRKKWGYLKKHIP